jgi:exosortase
MDVIEEPKKKSPPKSALRTVFESLWATPDGRISLIGLAGAAALITTLYWENLKHFTFVWSNDDNYSHGWLVAPLSLYFANHAAERRLRRNGTNAQPGDTGGVRLGALLLAAGLAGRLITVFLPIGLIADGSMILALAGAVSLIFGSRTLRTYAFPIAFLVFMIPLPVALYTMLANPLQMIVSRVAAGVMTACGIPVLCEGNMLTLPGDIRMFVAEACSGMRQLTGFLALTAAVAYLSGKPAWYRVVLVASAVPVAMVANIARVIVTGLIMYYVDPNYAQGAWHTVEGMVLMLGGLAILQFEMVVLNALTDMISTGGATKSHESEAVDASRSVVQGARV